MPTWEVNESLGVNKGDNILRVSRSTDGRRTIWFHPDWRRRQAVIYRNASSLNQSDRPFRIPEWEDDDLLINYFMFLASNGRCNSQRWTELISMATECDEWNDYHGMGTRIKALAISEWSNDEIGDKLGIDPEVVDTYIGIFFDIRSILGNKERLASIVFPFGPELRRKLSPSEQRENLWIAAAFSGDEQLLEFFTQNKFQMNRETMERNMEVIISMLTAQALEYGVYMRSEGLPRPAHFENFMGMQDVFAKHISAKAQQEALNNQTRATDQLEKWTELLTTIGIRRAVGREIQPDSLVTNLSISELRSGSHGSLANRKDKLRARVIDADTGVGVQSFNEGD